MEVRREERGREESGKTIYRRQISEIAKRENLQISRQHPQDSDFGGDLLQILDSADSRGYKADDNAIPHID